MGREDETEQGDEFRPYQVNGQLMAMARPRALFMHCLPAHRGEEVTADVFDGPHPLCSTRPKPPSHPEGPAADAPVIGTGPLRSAPGPDDPNE